MRRILSLALLGAASFAAWVEMMQRLDGYGGGMDVPTWRLAAMLLRAPEYSLADLRRRLERANWGRGPMWPDYRSRDLMAEVPEMPVPMRLIRARGT